MAKAVGSERRLKALMDVVISEMRANPTFAERVGAVLDPPPSEPAAQHAKESRPRAPRPPAAEGAAKRGNRRAASLVDPLTAIQSGQQQLRKYVQHDWSQCTTSVSSYASATDSDTEFTV